MASTDKPSLAPYESIGERFIRSYYSMIMNREKRKDMSSLYGPRSLFTVQHEDNVRTIVGAKEITSWLDAKLPNINFRVSKWDAQPLPNNAILVCVQGQVKLGQDQSPKLYTQSFTLLRRASETVSFYCHNDILQIYLPAIFDK